jgi:hypothetical protein
MENSGAAYVFRRQSEGTTSEWVAVDTLKANNPGESDFFGWSVAAADDGHSQVLYAVGAYGEDSKR